MLSDSVERLAVALVQTAVIDMGCLFREQAISDQGIDAHVETTDAIGAGSGRLLALQVKGGRSFFREPTEGGWWFRFSERHAKLWLRHSLPVVVVLVDTDTRVSYWREISPDSIESTGTNWKVEVLRSNTLDLAMAEWTELVDRKSIVAIDSSDNALETLPPRVVKVVRKLRHQSGADAQSLAAYLSEGRGNPGGIVRSLIAARPRWMEHSSGLAWRAVALFAGDHDLDLLAAESYEIAARSGDSEGDSLVNAALHLVAIDPDRAELLIERASEQGVVRRIEILGRAWLNRIAGRGEVAHLISELRVNSKELLESGAIQAFLAHEARRDGNTGEAVRRSALAIAAAPDEIPVMQSRARTVMWAVEVGELESDAADEAVQLLNDAITQARQWGGSTRELTVELARACLLRGDYTSIIEACLPFPHGSASQEDAADGDVREAATLAAALSGREDLVDRIVAGGEPLSPQFLYRIGRVELDRDGLIAAFEQQLEKSTVVGDNVATVSALVELSKVGVDRLSDLDELVRRGVVASRVRDLAAALLDAHPDFDGGLARLRSLASNDKQAAEILVAMLMRRSRFDEAVAVCDRILLLGRDDLFTVRRAEAMIEGRLIDAETVAVDTAASVPGFARERGRMLTFAAGEAAERGDWQVAESRLRNVVGLTAKPGAASVWHLVTAQLALGKFQTALRSVDTYEPEVRDANEARLWMQAVAPHPWDGRRASQALGIADAIDDPQLAVAILAHLIRTTTPDDETHADDAIGADLAEKRSAALESVPGELRRQAFDALERLTSEFGEEVGIQVISGSRDAQVEAIEKLLRERAERNDALSEIVEQARGGLMPFGLVAAVAGRSLMEVLVSRALGVLPAASADEDDYGSEFDAAQGAIGRRVVIDSTALLTVSNERLRELTAEFSSVITSDETARDTVTALTDIRIASSSPGTLAWDNAAGGIRLSEVPPQEYLRQLQRVGRVSALLNKLVVDTVRRPGESLRIEADAVSEAWASTIELAREQGLPLWSDDLAVRSLARSLGLDAFGTPALCDAVRQRGGIKVEDADLVVREAAAEVLVLAADRLVDLPLEAGDLVRLARAEDPVTGLHHLARASWWAWQERPFHQLSELVPVMVEAKISAMETLRAAMHGVAAAASSPEIAARLVCMVALVPYPGSETIESLVAALRIAKEVGDEKGFPDPIAELAAVTVLLRRIGLADDTTEGRAKAAAIELNKLAGS